ncbi:MAG TPA: contractile injection system protein, VgrG/Pvc8 family [Candidatus Binataceae bacterium]|nr:contractile injection system protein, VgrG/Pvc8 family [Candidatus Binataceae bacterium]
MSAAASYLVRSPSWILTYTGTNITADVSSMVISIAYHDYLASRAGEIEVALEDRDRLWQGAWYPALGDTLNLLIGYSGEPLLPCGDFEIDQLELDGPPDVFQMRCLAAYITPAMRTANSVAYENQSLLQIASTVASKYQLQVIGVAETINPVFARVTQKQESDLAFLKRLATSNGYDFTVRGTELVFYARSALEAQPPILTVARGNVERFAFENRTRLVNKAALVAYQDPASRQLIIQSVAATDIPTGDTCKLTMRCENGQQATLKAQAALNNGNIWFTNARLTLPGNTALSAGNTIALSGWASFDGVYLIDTSKHSLNRRTGYSTEAVMYRVG